MKKVMCIFLVLFTALVACASYKPTPAPIPMKTFESFPGEMLHGYFNIEDGSGPEGMTIIIEPNILTITSRVVTPISDFPNARRYTYYFDYVFGDISQKVTIKSYDNRKREVSNYIMFNVIEDELQVFTECGQITEPNEPVSLIWRNNYQYLLRNNTRNNLVFHYNRVIEGKESLSPKYENIDELKGMIAKYDNPAYVVMNGWLVE